ncbi:hypothetical protein [Mesonia aestuariivivens]|uniref:Ubiquinone biosynthesis protein COQ4 n=1 Tax=Mesonia aestuariivivens TaxID=2796128 RepID=A0ABS6VZE4_9FLAO|nr:hypothetical protein [Mesonia aestuariivivens]MBW2960874.1 hypothetical protein [Mesonia aestuariivivens]
MRKKLVIFLFEVSKTLYTKFFKQNHLPWDLTTVELLEFPPETFGYHLGEFLQKNNFELLPKVERHDAYHTLTNYGTEVEEEIGLQFLCMGNGKKCPYMYGAILLGTLILPEYLSLYLKSYQVGRAAEPFHHFDYEQIIHLDYELFKSTIFSKNTSTLQLIRN